MKKAPIYTILAMSLMFNASLSAANANGNDTSMNSDKQASYSLYNQFNGNVKSLLECATSQQKLIVVAHRGGYAPGYPENALNSLERTTKHIPTILELDVVSSSDGVDYLHHDHTLNRTTSGSGAYNSQTWSQIKKLYLRDDSFSITKQHPLRFDDMLSALKGRAFLMLDMKDPSSNKSIVEKVKAANMLHSSIFIAYNHEQAKEILAVEPNALIALGASSTEKVAAITASGLDKKPYVALSGDIASDAQFLKKLSADGHYVLGGSYFGENPADARLSTDSKIADFDNAAKNGFQMVVSNRPLAAHQYLEKNDLIISQCKSPK